MATMIRVGGTNLEKQEESNVDIKVHQRCYVTRAVTMLLILMMTKEECKDGNRYDNNDDVGW